MNKKILTAVIGVVVVAVVGGLVYYFQGGNLQGFMKLPKGVSVNSPVDNKAIKTGLPAGTGKINPELLTVHPYPISTNLILNRWSVCEDDRLRRYIYETSNIHENEDMTYVEQCENYLPLRFCGAKIYGPGSLVDTDGDGITNDREYFMGLNPCEKYSVGGTTADGDFDYDGDGLLNKNDPDPICNANGLYPSDCV